MVQRQLPALGVDVVVIALERCSTKADRRGKGVKLLEVTVAD